MTTIQKFYFAGAGLLTLASAYEGGFTAACVTAGVSLLVYALGLFVAADINGC
jgi:hypothetical protein